MEDKIDYSIAVALGYKKKAHRVYCAYEDIVLKYNVELMDYNSLSEEFREWILETYIKAVKNPTFAESKFKSLLESLGKEFYQQLFIKIDDKCFFLDFYLPKENVAIEIDGSSHKGQWENDHIRDVVLWNVGIKTLHFTNRDVYSKDIKSVFLEKLSNGKGTPMDNMDYYLIPECRKFDGKPTLFQRMIKYLTSRLKKMSNGRKVMILTNQTYIMYMLDHAELKESYHMANKELILDFYKTVNEKEIDYRLKFTGNRSTMSKKHKRMVVDAYKRCSDFEPEITIDLVEKFANESKRKKKNADGKYEPIKDKKNLKKKMINP